MSTEIYYYSGTGNSLHVARELEKRIPGSKLIPVISLLNQENIKSTADIVGFIFPVYLMSIPVPIRQILSRIDLKSADYIFAIATRMSYSQLVSVQIEKILDKKKRQLDSFFTLNMASNSPTGLQPGSMPGVKKRGLDWINHITPEKISALESGVQSSIGMIQKVIIGKEKYMVPKHVNLFTPFFKFLKHLFITPMDNILVNNKMQLPFYSDDRCTSCGLCETVCLSQKIKIIEGKPVWQKNVQCFYCYACFNCCPEQSILLTDTYTEKKGRYLHPDVTAEDIAKQKK